MFKFHCHQCGESFRVHFENLHNKQSLQCANCGFDFPQKAIESLVRLGDAYLDAIDTLYQEASNRKCWSISIESNDTLVPPPVGKYDHLDVSQTKRSKTSFWEHRNRGQLTREISDLRETLSQDPEKPF
ncbi:hypothetical protein [Paenibacillus amylolyticus]|uniref:hypothetical protein n=1 Tax=Paenibacillus amylolyticus TaxID=1451 RepID=UPI001115A940|nr:hypothetical protein [Paenibacillus amylolyticus]